MDLQDLCRHLEKNLGAWLRSETVALTEDYSLLVAIRGSDLAFSVVDTPDLEVRIPARKSTKQSKPVSQELPLDAKVEIRGT